jgi:hypothetical protein
MENLVEANLLGTLNVTGDADGFGNEVYEMRLLTGLITCLGC